ncbi:unnamed protein product, partial [Iphiclides podalirius]
MGEGTNPGVFFVGANGNGYRLSARGVQTLQSFLREHGAECVRQFMQVQYPRCFASVVWCGRKVGAF